MAVSVTILSREKTKPASPTPSHLRNLKISFLDQISPPVYVPMILFYQADQLAGCCSDPAQISQLLKKSLSNTLTMFYPLAGIIQNNFSIDCNDAGVEYVEAQVDADVQLSGVLQSPDMEELKQYLPIEPYSSNNTILLAVQLTFFSCGGVALGVCLSHKVADGSSLVTFLNAWAAAATGGSSKQTSFDLSSNLPAKDLAGFTPTVGITNEKVVTRRFVFDEKKIATLKEAISSASGSQVKNPTRVEAISAFVWRCFLEVGKAKTDTKKAFAAVHAVNLRTRMSPPLPDHAFGNAWSIALALSEGGSFEGSCNNNNNCCYYHDLVVKLRSAIKKIDGEYVKKLGDGDWYLDYMKRSGEHLAKGEMEFCNFSSWCRFPVYEVDFGWGKPVWACTTTLPFKNVVILMSTKSGDGIEAWVNMLEGDMTLLQQNHELLSLFADCLN